MAFILLYNLFFCFVVVAADADVAFVVAAAATASLLRFNYYRFSIASYHYHRRLLYTVRDFRG